MYSMWMTSRRTRLAANIAVAGGLLLAQLPPAFGQTKATTMPPVAPAIKPASAALTVHPAAATPPPVAPSAKTIDRNVAQQTAQVAELEKLMFGVPVSGNTLDQRINRLESEVFHSTNPEWDTARRIERLNQTLVGTGSATAPYPPARLPLPDEAIYPPTPPAQQQQQAAMPYNQNMDPALAAPYGGAYGGAENGQQPQPQTAQQPQIAMPPQPDLDSPEFTRELSRLDAEKYALDVVNEIRAMNGMSQLNWDDIAYKVAQQQVADLSGRSTVSHNNAKGENPDVRYTRAGGSDSMLEGLVSLKASGRVPLSKGLVYRVIKELTDSQDDRDALLSRHATEFAFSLNNNSRNDKVIAVSEVVTDVADLEPIPAEVKVGEKIDIKGTIKGRYLFNRITLAWEGLNPDAAAASDEEQDEALPYFPPLDYTAYAKGAEHDTEKLRRVLALAGVGAALAGSFFMPPVALAVPLLLTAAPGKPKALSEIPIKGGVNVKGQSFDFKAPISKDGKDGIYYVTVWVTDGAPDRDDATVNPPIAISRRAIIAHGSAESATPPTAKQPDKDGAILTHAGREKDKDADASK
jgi:uncharacterized protein YkwD